MSSGNVRSYVAFKRKCNEVLPIDIKFETSRSGATWSLHIWDEWASVWGSWHFSRDQTIEDFCADMVSEYERDSWNNAHCN